jgi:hypothetical protein
MKSNSHWALFRFESALSARFFVFPAILAGQVVVFSLSDILGQGIAPILLLTFTFIPIFWSYGFLFQDGRFGFWPRARYHQFGIPSLEFSFSRAIDRRILFWVRTLWFAFSASLPLQAFVVCSLISPDRRIVLLNRTKAPDAMQTFYLTHFPGAVLQTSDLTIHPIGPSFRLPAEHVLILPHEQIEFAAAVLGCGLLAAVAYQTLMLATLRFRRIQQVVPIVTVVLPLSAVFLLGFPFSGIAGPMATGAYRPPVVDQAMAWAIEHPLVLFVAGVAIITSCLRLGRERFGRQEVLPEGGSPSQGC